MGVFCSSDNLISISCALGKDFMNSWGPGGSTSWVVGLPNNSYKPITNTAWVHTRLCKLQKWCTRLAASDQVYQLLVHGRWFSPGTLASSTTKTGRHIYSWNIAESGVKTPKINQQSKSWIPDYDCASYTYFAAI